MNPDQITNPTCSLTRHIPWVHNIADLFEVNPNQITNPTCSLTSHVPWVDNIADLIEVNPDQNYASYMLTH